MQSTFNYIDFKTYLFQRIIRNRICVAWHLKCNHNTTIPIHANYPKGSLGDAIQQFKNTSLLHSTSNIQTHEIYHILSGYTTDSVGEICLQYFLAGNGKVSFFTFLLLLAPICYPEHIHLFIRAYNRGKKSREFHHWNFAHLLNENICDIKRMIFHSNKNIRIFHHITY